MTISPLWPKPPRWPIQPGAVDPNQRWVWHTWPRFILPLWEHASAGVAQRYVRLAQTRRTARTWQLNTGAAPTVTITSSVAIVNDTTWSTIVGTWRPGRLELYVDGFSHASSNGDRCGKIRNKQSEDPSCLGGGIRTDS